MGEKDDVVAVPASAAEVVSLTVVAPDELDEATPTLTLDQLQEMGFITPIADPRTVRAANQYRVKMINAMLDPNHDFLYTIPYVDGQGNKKEHVTVSLDEARRFETTYKTKYKANVKKSGVYKLCQVLMLQGRKIEHLGYPHDQKADWTQITYEVRQLRKDGTIGRVEQGVGLASIDERGGRTMPKHHLVTLADTRAHSRAVMRIAGLGEVGAEELMTAVEEKLPQITAPHPYADDLRPALPASTGAAPLDTAAPAETRVPVTTTTTPQAPPAATAPAIQHPPSNTDTPNTITDAQAAKLSQLAKAKLGTTERCVEWLREHAKVSSSRHVRERDYTALMKVLEAMEVP